MKTLIKKRANKIMFLAIAIIAVIAGMLIMTDIHTGLAVCAASRLLFQLERRNLNSTKMNKNCMKQSPGMLTRKVKVI